ncbi:GNAT family N-acetyltransferase [Phenylobacterium sp.]|uniref:GNAT family N-acetyltransferase n=1 Tax=Phenylobacterium sp. TaxID=1871053 RepID=UPI00286BA10E|nr:GNAT family N-acetyltransferase [Phenylobacterium sp.]
MSEDLKPWFPIRTERLLLRAFTPDDFDDVHAYATEDAVVRYMDWGPNTLEETKVFLGRSLEAQLSWPRSDVNLAIQHLADGKVIGAIRLGVKDEATRTGDIGYSIASAYWRQGLVTEAAGAMLRAGFEVLGLHRIWAECDVRNAGSYGVMEKLGMRREAHFRKDKRARDGWRDSYLYAILADEWILPGQN